jgi:hypothetical protein
MTRQPAGTMAASDAWSRAAQRVRTLAEVLGHPLDEQELVLQDVRALYTFEDRLERTRGRHAERHKPAHHGLRARIRAGSEGVLRQTARAV